MITTECIKNLNQALKITLCRIILYRAVFYNFIFVKITIIFKKNKQKYDNYDIIK